MMTVNEVSKRTGVSIRTLQYYDKIGLLRAAGRTEAGYRLYDDAALERLQQILLFRELEFPLKDIQKYCAEQVDTLWDEVKRFDNPHTYYVDLSQKLWDIKNDLLNNKGK